MGTDRATLKDSRGTERDGDEGNFKIATQQTIYQHRCTHTLSLSPSGQYRRVEDSRSECSSSSAATLRYQLVQSTLMEPNKILLFDGKGHNNSKRQTDSRKDTDCRGLWDL